MKKVIFFLTIVTIFLFTYPLFGKDSKIVFLIGHSASKSFSDALQSLGKDVESKVEFITVKEIEKRDSLQFDQSTILFVDTMYPQIKKVLKKIGKENKIYSLRGASKKSSKGGSSELLYDSEIIAYYGNFTDKNILNLIRYILNKEGIVSMTYEAPTLLPEVFLSYPGSGKFFDSFEDYVKWYKDNGLYKSNSFWVGITYYRAMLDNDFIKQFVKRFEDAGINVAISFSFPDYLGVKKFFAPQNVNFILGLSYKFSASVNDENFDTLKNLNTPVYNLISLFDASKESWELSETGLTPFEVSFQISLPEMGGLIEPTVVASNEEIKDNSSSKVVTSSREIAYQVDFIIQRIKKMRELQTKSNKDKKIAIFYYNHHPGKQNIGASYLNVMGSLGVILSKLREKGYDIPENFDVKEENLKQLMLLSGRNVGNYAPGEIEELVKTGKVEFLQVEDYLKMVESFPRNFINPIMEKWGDPKESKIMFYNGKFIIPMVKISDKVIILPQPSRGWGEDIEKMYHDVTLPPHHQYVAVYMWLKNIFNADAFINLGTHGTHEWMPGKQVGTIYWDNGDFLVQDIPLLYPYVMDDVGEALQAKRRGRGVILSHLTPAMKKGSLFDKYSELGEIIQQYNSSFDKDKKLKEEKLNKIKRIVIDTGLYKDLNLKLTETKDIDIGEDDIENIEHYLLDIKQEVLPFGLHTYGKIDLKEAEEFAKLLSEKHSNDKDFLNKLKMSAKDEIDNLINGLNGGYIPPGKGNDPLRAPDAIPTGKNLYAFDSSKIPSEEAYNLGIKLVEDKLKKYKEQHSASPKKVEVILWSVETCRDEGIGISEALYYMGIKPKWDSKGKVVGVEAIPGNILKRGRIDVLLQTSGLFRDMFPNLINLLDDAVKLAKNQTDVENFIRDNSARLEKLLIAKGYSKEEAENISDIRIFGAPPGAYGTMVSELTGNSGVWDNESNIAEVYINRLSYGFSRSSWGKPLKDVFKENLKDVDIVSHTISTNLYGTMDNDDFFQYAGGAVLAVRSVTGKSPELFVSRSADPKNVFAENISKTVGKEFRIRYTNPEWIKGMMKDGYAGAREMSNFVEYMWGWQVTVPDIVDSAKWQETFDVYTQDRYNLGIKKFFEKDNPWAYQSINARMLEAVRKSYWKADEATVKKLSVEYALNVINHGVACCDHTCNNPMLNQMVVNIISLPGVMSPELVEQFKATITKAIGKPLDQAVKDREELLDKLSNIVEEMKSKNVNGKTDANNEVKGYEMKEETKKEDSQATSSGVQWYLMIFVFAIIFIIFTGIMRRKKVD